MTTPSPLEWRVPQDFATATSEAVRGELIDIIGRDLLGPWAGEDEECAPRAAGPRDRYLIGMLGPRTVPGTGPATEPGQADTETGGDADGDPELPEVLSPQALGRIWASSMGLSFAVDPSVTAVAGEASWGSYLQRESAGEAGKTRRVWYREPVRHAVQIRTDAVGDTRVYLSGTDGDEEILVVSVRPDARSAGRCAAPAAPPPAGTSEWCRCPPSATAASPPLRHSPGTAG